MTHQEIVLDMIRVHVPYVDETFTIVDVLGWWSPYRRINEYDRMTVGRALRGLERKGCIEKVSQTPPRPPFGGCADGPLRTDDLSAGDGEGRVLRRPSGCTLRGDVPRRPPEEHRLPG